MSVEPTSSSASDRVTSDPAPLVPTDITAGPVTAREIAEFLRHLAELRASGGERDLAARAAFLHRKTELFTRLAADPPTPARAPGKSVV